MYINNQLYLQDIEKTYQIEFDKFKNASFLITGATGLIGSAVIDFLLFLNRKYNFNIKVYALCRSKEIFTTRFKSFLSDENLIPIFGDILSPLLINIIPDYIIHAASYTHPKVYNDNPVETMCINFLGTLNVLNFAKTLNRTRFLYISTFEVYGEILSDTSISEDDYGYINIKSPRACYPESKRSSETLCYSYANEYAIDIVTVRLGYIYGPCVKLSSSKADVQFLNSALLNEPIKLKSSGKQKRSYCYVFDVVSALLYILLNAPNSEIYNVSSESGNVTLFDVASLYSKASNVPVVFEQSVITNSDRLQNSVLNSTKLNLLGWMPKFSLIEGIYHTYQIKKDIMINNYMAKRSS